MSRQFTPPQFASFGKAPNKNLFQVYDKDSLDHNVRVVSKARGGVEFDGQIVYEPKKNPRGVAKLSFVNSQVVKGVAVDATFQTEASKASTLTLKKKNAFPTAFPGLDVTVTDSTSEKDFSAAPKYGFFGTVGLDYTRNNFAASAQVVSDADTNVALSASAAVGFEGFSLGGDVKLVKSGEGSLAPKSYNAGLAYSYKQYTGALVSDSKFEKIKATLLATKLGSAGQFNVGVQAKVDLQAPKVGAPQREVIVALDEVATPNTTYRLALASTGSIVAGVEHKLRNPDIALAATVATALPGSFYAPFPVTKFGVALTMGDY